MSTTAEDTSPPQWFAGPRVLPLVAMVVMGIVTIGGTVIWQSFTREAPMEAVAGFAIVLIGIALLIWGVARREDPLVLLVAIGFFVQFAALLYYYYSGFSRDANSYHRAAQDLLDPDADLPPRMQASGSEWSNYVVVVMTATVYRFTGESQMMAFVAFSSAGVLAKAIFAATLLRMRDVLGRASDLAAFGVMVFPSLALWLSPIGKEATAVLGVSLVIAGIVRRPGESPRVLLILLGLASTGLTRPHVSMLLGGAVVAYACVAALFTQRSLGRRVAIVVSAAVLSVGSLVVAANFFGVDPSLSSLGEVRDDVSERSDDGGASIEARPIRSPIDVPFATANVLIRPWPFETSGVSSLLQSGESMFILLLIGWLAFQRRRRAANRLSGVVRRQIQTFRVFGLTYTAGFVFAFSSMYNLGLMSRQRTQFTLVLLLLLGLSLVSTKRPKAEIRGPLQMVGADQTTEPTEAAGRSPLVLQPPLDVGPTGQIEHSSTREHAP
ncbi:MAG: hypothetical protein JJT89_01140 [Nitriliruptoraceae bacterium]|nr:hypothetical protein [Nitriliruptoraceae bacterium]